MTSFFPSRTFARRAVLARMVAVGGSALLPLGAKAQTAAAIGFRPTPAIAVKAPAQAFLVAMAWAGRRLVAAGEEGIIIISDDDGASWTQAEVPVSDTLTTVIFQDEAKGWAAGHSGVILGTRDGGKSWYLALDGLQVNQLMLAAAAAPQNVGFASAALVLAAPRARIFDAAGADKPFLDLLLLPNGELFAMGAYRMMVLSQDGGRSWVDWSLHVSDHLSDDLYASAVSGGTIYLAGSAGKVFSSTDGAASFNPLPFPQAVSIFGLLAPVPNLLIAFGVAGNCFRSTDGGQSWAQIALGTQDNLTCGLMMGQDLLIASESGQIFRSQDGGQTFAPLSGVPPMPIFSMVQAADGGLILAGDTGIGRVPARAMTRQS